MSAPHLWCVPVGHRGGGWEKEELGGAQRRRKGGETHFVPQSVSLAHANRTAASWDAAAWVLMELEQTHFTAERRIIVSGCVCACTVCACIRLTWSHCIKTLLHEKDVPSRWGPLRLWSSLSLTLYSPPLHPSNLFYAQGLTTMRERHC